MALRLWGEVKVAARAGAAVRAPGGARHRRVLCRCLAGAFLAVRAELIEAWRPRDGLEGDAHRPTGAVADAAGAVAGLAGRLDRRRRLGRRPAAGGGLWRLPPRLSEAEAVGRSAAMVERVHRMYLADAEVVAGDAAAGAGGGGPAGGAGERRAAAGQRGR